MPGKSAACCSRSELSACSAALHVREPPRRRLVLGRRPTAVTLSRWNYPVRCSPLSCVRPQALTATLRRSAAWCQQVVPLRVASATRDQELGVAKRSQPMIWLGASASARFDVTIATMTVAIRPPDPLGDGSDAHQTSPRFICEASQLSVCECGI